MSEKETINNKIKKLDEKVGWFYGESFTLDEAENKFKEAIALSKEIETDLNSLKNKIEILSEDFS